MYCFRKLSYFKVVNTHLSECLERIENIEEAFFFFSSCHTLLLRSNAVVRHLGDSKLYF